MGGAPGGFVASYGEVGGDVLRNKARTYLFTNSLPLKAVGAATETSLESTAT